MSYGTTSSETQRILADAGLTDALNVEWEELCDDCEVPVSDDGTCPNNADHAGYVEFGHYVDPDTRTLLDTLDIDVMVSGALDESFTVRAFMARDVVEAIAKTMPDSVAPGEEWEVAAYVPGDSVDFVMRSEDAG